MASKNKISAGEIKLKFFQQFSAEFPIRDLLMTNEYGCHFTQDQLPFEKTLTQLVKDINSMPNAELATHVFALMLDVQARDGVFAAVMQYALEKRRWKIRHDNVAPP